VARQRNHWRGRTRELELQGGAAAGAK
jgi:hypothetical protein